MMSHFPVLVIGDDVDDQLAPFQEGLEIEFEDTTDEFRKRYKTESTTATMNDDGEWEYDRSGTASVPFKKLYSTFEKFCSEYLKEEPNEDGNYGYRYNPNAKWDWYVVGGRWTGSLKAKPGVIGQGGDKPGWFDQLTVGTLDLEGMQQECAEEASSIYSNYEKAVAGLEVPLPWTEYVKGFLTVDDAREARNKLPYIKALQNAKLISWASDPVEEYAIGREAFVQKAIDDALPFYAVIKGGIWYAKGEMGWFGMDIPYELEKPWNEVLKELLLSSPPDTVITVVDCHI